MRFEMTQIPITPRVRNVLLAVVLAALALLCWLAPTLPKLLVTGMAVALILSFPVIILYMIIIAVFGPSALNIILAVTFIASPQIARIVRGLTLELREQDFVAAAKMRGENPLYAGSWGSYSINDVSAILPVMLGGGNDDYARDPQLQKLIAEGGNSNDEAVRKKAYSAAIKLATEQAYWLPLHTYVNTYGFVKTLEFRGWPDELPRFYMAKWK